MRAKTILVLIFLFVGVSDLGFAAPKRSSSAVAVTTDGSVLLCVNPDSNSVTLVDTTSASVIAEIPVGTDPRTVAVDDASTRAYVCNRGSESLSVIDITGRRNIAQVEVGGRPYGVVVSPGGKRVYVTV